MALAGAPQKRLPWVQALRAFAALSVAFTHIMHDAIANGADPRGVYAAIDKFMPWDAGVDIFFVISGFVIVHASASLFAHPKGALMFLRRRLTRIVPLYWIMTTAFLAVLVLGHSVIHGDIGGPSFLAASYLFIPWPRPDGTMQPAFGLGWTLNYEMFFYAVFTPFLLLSRHKAVTAAAFLLAAFVLLGQAANFLIPQFAYWSRPIILEFVFGMAIAQVFAAGVTIPLPARLALAAAAIIAFHFTNPYPSALLRPIAFGLPAAALVAAAGLTTPPHVLSLISKRLILLGDASYAMYLVHPFVMRGFTVLWHRFHAANELAGTMYIAAGLLTAQLCALWIHANIERKLYVTLRNRAGVKHEVI